MDTSGYGFCRGKLKYHNVHVVIVCSLLMYCLIAFCTTVFKPNLVLQEVPTPFDPTTVDVSDITKATTDAKKIQKYETTIAGVTSVEKYSNFIVRGKSIEKLYLDKIRVKNVVECRKKKLLVYVCEHFCGGLGDRFKGIVSIFLLALLSNRSFVIDMVKPCGLERILDPNDYDWTICKNYTGSFGRFPVNKSEIFKGRSGLFWKMLRTPDTDDGTVDKKVVRLTSNSYIMDSLRQHNDSYKKLKWILDRPDWEIIHLILHTLFKPGRDISSDLNHFVLNNFKNRSVVCSHLRIGRNPSNPHDSILRWGTPNATKVFSFLSKYTNSEKYVIYIASDSEELKSEAAKTFPNFVSSNRTIVHVDRPGSSRTTEEVCTGLYDVLFEHTLLSSCDTLLLSRSNYGAIASYIRGRSDNLYMFINPTNTIKNASLSDVQKIYKFV